MSKYRCGQIFCTYLGGWEGCSPVRRECGAQPREFLLDDFWSILEKMSYSWKTEFLEMQREIMLFIWKPKGKSRMISNWKYTIATNWKLRDRETRLFGAVSSRGKDWCVEVPPNNCHGPVRNFLSKSLLTLTVYLALPLTQSTLNARPFQQSIKHTGSEQRSAPNTYAQVF